jgi:hypothetical protein
MGGDEDAGRTYAGDAQAPQQIQAVHLGELLVDDQAAPVVLLRSG